MSAAEPARRRILIVTMHASVHVERWLSMVRRDDTAILVFPSFDAPADNPLCRRIALSDASTRLPAGLWVVSPKDISSWTDRFVDLAHGYRRWRHGFMGRTLVAAPGRLAECIERFAPEVVHSMEVQMAGYLCLEAARRMGRWFPPWILSNWGSDIALFRKLGEHEGRIQRICRRIDYYLAECHRDQKVAREYGYGGPILPVIPASGGVDVQSVARHRRIAPSQRRTLHIKGYHGWSGRALVALSAVALAHKHLRGFQIEVASFAGPQVVAWVEMMRRQLGLDIHISPYLPDHNDAMDRLADARAVVGVGISDGISTTLLEAMAVGTLPIQSSTACADEWVQHGKSGFIVSPHDTQELGDAIREAMTNHQLVEQAAAMNLATVTERWDAKKNRQRVWDVYDLAAGRKADA